MDTALPNNNQPTPADSNFVEGNTSENLGKHDASIGSLYGARILYPSFLPLSLVKGLALRLILLGDFFSLYFPRNMV